MISRNSDISGSLPNLQRREWPPFSRLLCALLLTGILLLPARAQSILAHIRETHTLRCAINAETPEYSTSDDHGPRIAFDTDLCRAVAIAILGPTARIVVAQSPDDVATAEALTSGHADLIPSQTLDLTHASNPAFTFTQPTLYDAVGLLVPAAAHLTRASDLSGKKVCFLAETEVEVALRAWFTQQHLHFVPFPFQEEGEMNAAFVTGNCAALAGDLTRLAATRLAFGPAATHYALLSGQLSQDPLAAATRSTGADAAAFAAIVRWTLQVLLQAEALNLTQKNIAAISTDPNPAVVILTGHTREIGTRLNLDNAWAAQVVAAVGNYGEIFDRDLGEQSPLQLPRGLNRLYTQGGLMYPLPLK